MSESASAERLESEFAKSGTKWQDLIMKTHEDNYKGIANYNELNRGSQTIHYNI